LVLATKVEHVACRHTGVARDEGGSKEPDPGVGLGRAEILDVDRASAPTVLGLVEVVDGDHRDARDRDLGARPRAVFDVRVRDLANALAVTDRRPEHLDARRISRAPGAGREEEETCRKVARTHEARG